MTQNGFSARPLNDVRVCIRYAVKLFAPLTTKFNANFVPIETHKHTHTQCWLHIHKLTSIHVYIQIIMDPEISWVYLEFDFVVARESFRCRATASANINKLPIHGTEYIHCFSRGPGYSGACASVYFRVHSHTTTTIKFHAEQWSVRTIKQ